MVFYEIIGISDGKQPIEICCRYSNILELKGIFKRDKKRLRRKEIEKYVVECTDSGERFRQAFTLFVVATMLVPISGSCIPTFRLYNIIDVESICTRNWASWCFVFLVASTTTWKKKPQRYCYGCVLFLQVHSDLHISFDRRCCISALKICAFVVLAFLSAQVTKCAQVCGYCCDTANSLEAYVNCRGFIVFIQQA